ncbi:TIGR03885 family FMN-dependent LLM class oxidoreductase [Actinotalea ferrariae]|uniref:TIGR03885 family FMN-dependent LLM class oxidoreductase n=1 Tax=Actinotalea ferrariae TaxID=1386098 RepID=UPI001C8B47A7|nr:TIGR03885 family FMN-dependent LLM class oxidoreductase [Actinotalea ferrariae]MBX9245100.1 TIGR03885 family FMN-dependent LLM class oxidoreductase [Actinotalea ferrariae]
MTTIGYHASHEQVHPAALLRAVQQAEQAGFDAAMCSDHFAPWSARQGHSGFAWSWLGAALATTSLRFGVVNAPGQRYHPAIIAQAAATLAAMFPGRFWAALGSGENANEHITGDPWPVKDVRDDRLVETVGVIRRLLAGEEVTHHGLVTVDRARIWTLPEEPPALIGPAVTVATARRCASWADGLITINQPHEVLREMVAAYREEGGRGPLALQVHVSWAPDQAEAEHIAFDQWRSNVFPPPVCWDLATPEHFDVASSHVRPEDVHKSVLVSSDLAQQTAWIAELASIGFDEVYLHHVGQEQEAFVDAFGEHVLPQLKGIGATA